MSTSGLRTSAKLGPQQSLRAPAAEEPVSLSKECRRRVTCGHQQQRRSCRECQQAEATAFATAGGNRASVGGSGGTFLVTGINVKVIMAGGNVKDEVTFNSLVDIPSHSSDKLVAPVLHPAKKHNEAQKLCEHQRQRSR